MTPDDVPSIQDFVKMITADDRLQVVPSGDWRFDDSVVILDVHPSNSPAAYWRAALRDDAGTADRNDAIRFVAVRLHGVAVEGFPPSDFTEHRDGWYRISMTTGGQVGDYVPEDWRDR